MATRVKIRLPFLHNIASCTVWTFSCKLTNLHNKRNRSFDSFLLNLNSKKNKFHTTNKRHNAHRQPMSADNLNEIDLDNPEFQNAWSLIQHTHHSVFLTGKAGTGKSTFLRYICKHTAKKYVVLAPTGIAAVNVNGQTLHSFFKIPFKPLLPDDPDFSVKRIRKTLRYPSEKIKLIKQLDLIIIDEISMVRADIIDFIDKVLRVYSGNMREPFGGKQLLFVGDIFQLEPVVTREMREILKIYYKQFFFFNAFAFGNLGLVPIELRKIYRQTDSSFISLLDRVRVNRATQADLTLLNSRCNPQYTDTGNFVVTLATRRDTVDAINDEHMQALKTKEYHFCGLIEGLFPDNDLPTAKELVLKEGAQVIFIRNDKDGRWVNGTIGKVSELKDDNVKVALEDGNTYDLDLEMWENIQYSYDEREKKVIENVQGSFTQYPIKPAWALTVHKSQGLTFNNIVIDFAGGAFSSGQTYVALSRCTSLEGITLLKPISGRDIIVNTTVVDFSRQFNSQLLIDNAMKQEHANELFLKSVHAFDHNLYSECVNYFVEANKIKDVTSSLVVQRFVAVKLNKFGQMGRKIERLKLEIEKRDSTLRQLAGEYVEMGNQALGYGTLASEEETTYGKSAPKLDEIAIKSSLANYNKALSLWPSCTDAMVGKGKLLMAIDETDAAEKELKRAIAIDNACFDAHLTLGKLYESVKDTAAAIKSYKRAIKADKTEWTPHDALADIYEKIGLDDMAETHRTKAQKLRNKRKAGTTKKKRERGS